MTFAFYLGAGNIIFPPLAGFMAGEHLLAAMCGFLLPTCNQVSDLLRGLDDGPFTEIEVLEILVRRYKTVADRLRPEDRMVAHTGFLVFARCMEKPAPFTRPPKVEAAEADPDLGPETDGDLSGDEENTEATE